MEGNRKVGAVKKPVLVIMAAGMGSRFGGLKQMTPIDAAGHVIVDYSIYDAARAGFETVICVIKPEMEADFRAVLSPENQKRVTLLTAYQELTDIPEGFSVPEGRTKPWGTAHALLAARELVDDAPFAVINADDFYGQAAFEKIYRFLWENQDLSQQAMVGYRVGNTLTENGSVSRGVCEIDADGNLRKIVERMEILPDGNGAKYRGTEGEGWVKIPAETIVSMNVWGFMPGMMQAFEAGFVQFLQTEMPQNPLACEYYILSVPNQMIQEGSIRLQVLSSTQRWFGITYAQDLQSLQKSVVELQEQGIYPRAF